MAAFSPPHVKPMLHYQSTFTQSTPRRLPLTTLQPHSIQPRIVSSDDEALSPKKALRWSSQRSSGSSSGPEELSDADAMQEPAFDDEDDM